MSAPAVEAGPGQDQDPVAIFGSGYCALIAAALPLFGVLRGGGAVALFRDSTYTFRITNSPCTRAPAS